METGTALPGSRSLLSLPSTVIVTALALGIAADFLFWDTGPVDLALAIWVTLFCAAAAAFSWRLRTPWWRSVMSFAGLAALAPLVLLFRDLAVLHLAMLGIAFAAALQILLRTAGVSFRAARLSHLFRAIPLFPLQAGFGIWPLLARLDITGNWQDPRTRGIVRGLLLALPLLVLFIALFASADEGFNRYVPDIATLFSASIAEHLALIALFFVISGGLLAGLLKPRTLDTIEIPFRLGSEETAIVLGLLSALFVTFVLLQLRYLFGGQDTIVATTGLTLAAYARRGFFELLWVAALTLGLLIFVARTTAAPHLLRRFGTVLVACVLLMLLSAAQRMQLYIISFGLSVDRVVACTVMLWIAFCLVLCAFTVLRGRGNGFASGMANLGITCCFMLMLVNPGKLVATVNIDRALEQQQSLDVNYLLTRGADVIAPLLDRFDELPAPTQCHVAVQMLYRWPQTPAADANWRTWNYSRDQARALLATNNSRLQSISAEWARRNDEARQAIGEQRVNLPLCPGMPGSAIQADGAANNR